MKHLPIPLFASMICLTGPAEAVSPTSYRCIVQQTSELQMLETGRIVHVGHSDVIQHGQWRGALVSPGGANGATKTIGINLKYLTDDRSEVVSAAHLTRDPNVEVAFNGTWDAPRDSAQLFCGTGLL